LTLLNTSGKSIDIIYTYKGIIVSVDDLNPAKLINRGRLLAGLTQAELAIRAGTSQPAVARYEAGQASPSAVTLTRLLRACGYDLEVRLKKAKASDLSSPRGKKVREHRGAILALAKMHGATNVRVFGSVARGEDHSDSDIDFLVDYPDVSKLHTVTQLLIAIEDLLNEKVDVSPTCIMKPDVLAKATTDAIPL